MAQWIRHQPPKLRIVGSSPTGGNNILFTCVTKETDQLVQASVACRLQLRLKLMGGFFNNDNKEKEEAINATPSHSTLTIQLFESPTNAPKLSVSLCIGSPRLSRVYFAIFPFFSFFG